MYSKGEVWFVEFPLEEDNSQTINRPVVVLDENTLGVLSVKITKHSPRKEDPYDTPIIYWQEANLRLASTARVSKVFLLSQQPRQWCRQRGMQTLECRHAVPQ